MQIFLLSLDPVENATLYMDKHVIKTPAEIQQILVSACARMKEPFPNIRTQNGLPLLPKPSIENNPFTKWASSNKANFRYLKLVGLSLCQEYLFRFGQKHLNFNNLWSFPDFLALDEPQLHRYPWMIPMAFQDKRAGIVESYRSYYIEAKNHLANWTLRSPPVWYPKDKIDEGKKIATLFKKAKQKPVEFDGFLLDLRKEEVPNE